MRTTAWPLERAVQLLAILAFALLISSSPLPSTSNLTRAQVPAQHSPAVSATTSSSPVQATQSARSTQSTQPAQVPHTPTSPPVAPNTNQQLILHPTQSNEAQARTARLKAAIDTHVQQHGFNPAPPAIPTRNESTTSAAPSTHETTHSPTPPVDGISGLRQRGATAAGSSAPPEPPALNRPPQEQDIPRQEQANMPGLSPAGHTTAFCIGLAVGCAGSRVAAAHGPESFGLTASGGLLATGITQEASKHITPSLGFNPRQTQQFADGITKGGVVGSGLATLGNQLGPKTETLQNKWEANQIASEAKVASTVAPLPSPMPGRAPVPSPFEMGGAVGKI